MAVLLLLSVCCVAAVSACSACSSSPHALGSSGSWAALERPKRSTVERDQADEPIPRRRCSRWKEDDEEGDAAVGDDGEGDDEGRLRGREERRGGDREARGGRSPPLLRLSTFAWGDGGEAAEGERGGCDEWG